jgi:hypothetical protein
MPIVISQGGPVLGLSAQTPTICLKAVFQPTINLKAILVRC